MRVTTGDSAACHLSYCTNIHPGETLSDVRRALDEYTAPIANNVSPHAPFGVGLRLSAAAALSLREPQRLREMRAWLDAQRLYVFTINGFPFGAFHNARVKQSVYRPDWRDAERVDYTLNLAHALSGLLPDGVNGSISTVPGGFRDDIVGDDDRAQIAENLITVAIDLHRMRETTGQTIAVALEPEPHCQLETLQEATAFFSSALLSRAAIARVVTKTGLSASDAEQLLRRHMGLCLDTCHAAVEYESIGEALRDARALGVDVKKMQLSNALRIEHVNDEVIARLRPFIDDVYLHQVVERSADDPGMTRFVDLPDAIEAFVRRPRRGVEWRIHFHIPIFAQPQAPLSSTRSVLLEAIEEQRRAPFTEHIEVETYTWDVLPTALRESDVKTSIVRELRFARAALQGEDVA